MADCRWWVSWAGPDPEGGGETLVLVDAVADHRAADLRAHHLADDRGGVATVARPDGRPVAVYTSTPKNDSMGAEPCMIH
jgi:hypothetical protein